MFLIIDRHLNLKIYFYKIFISQKLNQRSSLPSFNLVFISRCFPINKDVFFIMWKPIIVSVEKGTWYIWRQNHRDENQIFLNSKCKNKIHLLSINVCRAMSYPTSSSVKNTYIYIYTHMYIFYISSEHVYYLQYVSTHFVFLCLYICIVLYTCIFIFKVKCTFLCSLKVFFQALYSISCNVFMICFPR